MIADAVQFGDLLLLSGRAAVDPATLSVIAGGFEAQAQRVLDDIDAVLAAAGANRSQVLRVECFLADAADFPAWNAVWSELLHAAAPGPHHRRHRIRGPRHPDRAPGDRRPRRVAQHERSGRRRRRRHRRALLRLLPAAARLRRHDRREQPHRLGRLLRERRLALPRPGRAAARAGPDAVRHARALRPRLGALLQARRAGAAWRPGSCGSGRTATSATTRTARRAIAQPRPRRVRPGRRTCRPSGVEFELHKQGMVYAARERRGRARRAAQARSRCASSATSCPTTSSRAPSCTSSSRRSPPRSTAGFLVRQHWHVRPDTFTAGLAAALRRDGVEIQEGAEVFELGARRDGGSRTCGPPPATSRPTPSCSRRALGRRALARSIGISIPMEAGKGYSFSSARPSCRRTRSCSPTCTSAARRTATACASAARWSSAASTTASTGAGSTRSSTGARAVVPCPWATPEIEAEWAGMRPITADGLPILDRAGGLRQHLHRDRLRDAGRDAGAAVRAARWPR